MVHIVLQCSCFTISSLDYIHIAHCHHSPNDSIEDGQHLMIIHVLMSSEFTCDSTNPIQSTLMVCSH